jgi:DNA-binding transcriptional LysR family regulator
LTIHGWKDRLLRVPYQSTGALEQLLTFVAVVEANGFTAAARAMNARKATLSRRVRQLEERLGVSLLARTTRTLNLTDEGRAYLEHARKALAAATDAEAVVADAKRKPSGVLRVTSHPELASALLEAVVAPYLARYRDVTVHLDTSARRMDLVRDGYDLAIRIGPLEESSLRARKLGMTSGGYFASKECLQRYGRPKRPEDLETYPTIVVTREGTHEWPFVVSGTFRSIVVRPRLAVGGFDLAVRAAVAGIGVVRSPEHFVVHPLAKRQLEAILTQCTPPEKEVFAVYPPRAALVPKTRLFIDAVAGWFKNIRSAPG